MKSHKIEAVTVNHNTSRYMELMLRSLFARHSQKLNLSVTVFDNASTDAMSELKAYAASQSVGLVQSGFTTKTTNNPQGEILSRFVLEHPDCTHYLFLGADICFVEENTIGTLLTELEGHPKAFGIGPRLSWDGLGAIPEDARIANPDICGDWLPPCCALVRNTALFRTVVSEFGLSAVKYLGVTRDESVEPFKLMTQVMKTHGFKHMISASSMVLHFFGTSCRCEPVPMRPVAGTKQRDELLSRYREKLPANDLPLT